MHLNLILSYETVTVQSVPTGFQIGGLSSGLCPIGRGVVDSIVWYIFKHYHENIYRSCCHL